MINKTRVMILLIVLLTISAVSVKAGVSAYVFGDYYVMMQSPVESQKDQHGFWIRRIYLTYDSNISDKIKARVRFEMHQDGKLAGNSATIDPFVKDAYVSYQFVPLHSITIGIQDSLTFNNIEKFWGYRHLEKTPFDLYKNRSSRDFAFTLKGNFDKGKKFGYALQFGNNSSNKDEADKYKQVSGQFSINPTGKLTFEFTGDYVKKSETKSSTLFQGFAGYQGGWGRIGLNYGVETLKEDGKENVNFGVFSGFIVGKISEVIEAVVRYDITADPQVNGNDRFLLIEKGYKTSLLMAGIGWNIHPKFQVLPNIKIVSYKENDNGVKPDSFSQFNVTFYYVF